MPRKLFSTLTEYFENPEGSNISAFKQTRIFDESSQNSQELRSVLDGEPPELVYFDDLGETKLKDEFDEKNWKNLFPSLSSVMLEKFRSKTFNLHLNALAEENLLDIGHGNIYFQSKSRKNDMFFLSKVGTERERGL